ncbi:hypothetical protein G5714_021904 [Onychostoma macrolepis]|uniref:Uncharacterized protein n=1 Tax=Onychostoma macrolepis TaxID=369639 RepID=A0A7J6BSF2_9TELE|nr:hypothetical protein G5714_021904 [Onychostoma macrolepis]
MRLQRGGGKTAFKKLYRDGSEIMDMEESTPTKEHRYDGREEGGAPCPSCVSTNSFDRHIDFKNEAVNPEAIKTTNSVDQAVTPGAM